MYGLKQKSYVKIRPNIGDLVPFGLPISEYRSFFSYIGNIGDIEGSTHPGLIHPRGPEEV